MGVGRRTLTDSSTIVLIVLGVASLAAHAAVFPWVHYQATVKGPERGKKLVREVLADPEVVASLQPKVPGGWKGPTDPTEAVAARWAKEAERKARIASARAEILAWLMERMDAEKAGGILAWLQQLNVVNDDVLGKVADWKPLVEPIVARGIERAKKSDEKTGSAW